MDIDWSKAPEGATHWDSECDVFADRDGWWSSNCLVRIPGAQCGWGTDRYVPRPAEPWNGEGLPPVGTVCEAKYVIPADEIEYHKCKIIHHGSLTEAVAIDLEPGKNQRPFWTRFFRPIRTAEKIAAEERKAEINRIIEASVGPCAPNGISWAVADAIYKAGYRKQVQP